MKNRVQLIGHVGQDPEIKQLESGRVANFTIATNDSYTNAKGEKVEQTEWHRVSAWGKTVDIIEQFLTKGSHVAVEAEKEGDPLKNSDACRCVVGMVKCIPTC